mmetsp:Transcript_8284/g.28187  ORF Transcript_8284/g.28187 Transcript_8284/m.28187 type:complete len:109 (+) Transcript_8284:130-456(+)
MWGRSFSFPCVASRGSALSVGGGEVERSGRGFEKGRVFYFFLGEVSGVRHMSADPSARTQHDRRNCRPWCLAEDNNDDEDGDDDVDDGDDEYVDHRLTNTSPASTRES